MREIYVYFIILLFLLAGEAEAKIVKYIDEHGRIHYVNTDYSKVPEEYLYQVQGQLEPADSEPSTEKSTETSTDDTDDTAKEPAGENLESGEPDTSQETSEGPGESPAEYDWQNKDKGLLVQIFVSVDCPVCQNLEAMLKKYGVVYYRYDINTTPYGKKVYEEMGVEPPIVLVHQEWIYGFTAEEIEPLIQQKIEEYQDFDSDAETPWQKGQPVPSEDSPTK